MPNPYDPAYIPGANPVMPVAQPFAAGAGGIMPGTPGSMGLIPPMPQMAMPGLSPYGPAIPGTQSVMPAPMGGFWNQMAQHMAGPMFMPPHPGAGIPYPNPVMPGGPVATVAAPKPPAPPVAPPMPMPIGIPPGGRIGGGQLLGGGGQLLGGGGGGLVGGGGTMAFGGVNTFPRALRL